MNPIPIVRASGLSVSALLLLSATACTRVSPDAGVEAVLVEKPVFFSDLMSRDGIPLHFDAVNLSPQEFVELQRISMQREVCARRSNEPGQGCTFIVGNATPVVSTR